MTKALKTEIESLKAELSGYVGEKQAEHHVWMIEHCLGTECIKVGGAAWLKRLRNRLVQLMSEPTTRRISQTTPETIAWGGFLSDTVTYVTATSLREQASK